MIGKLLTPNTWAFGGRRNEATRHVRLARPLLGALGRVSPEVCGRCAALVFHRPPRFSRSRGEDRILAGATRLQLSGRRGNLAAWEWGTGPRVLLVHGWGGNAGRLRHFVAPLLEAGFGVTAFDAPAHGSSRGRFATLPDFIETIRLIARRSKPVGLIGHSMGGAACALALKDGLCVRAAVLLSPPAEPLRYALRFARYLRLSGAAVAAMTRRLEAHYATPLENLNAAAGGPAIPMLVFHDEADARVPIRDGRAIAASWPSARLVATRGLGHHRILRDPGVVAQSIAFVSSAARPERALQGGSIVRNGHAS